MRYELDTVLSRSSVPATAGVESMPAPPSGQAAVRSSQRLLRTSVTAFRGFLVLFVIVLGASIFARYRMGAWKGMSLIEVGPHGDPAPGRP
jgi:hypothetical protein